MSGKANKAEAEERLIKVQKWLLGGYTRSDIFRFASGWGIGERAIEHYITKAWENIHEAGKATREENFSLVSTNLLDLYRECLIMNDRKTALQALSQYAKIRGLEVHTVNHQVHDRRELKEKSDDELDQLLLVEGH